MRGLARSAVAIATALALGGVTARRASAADLAPDAGTVRYACPEAPEPAVVLDGGYWVPKARADRLACLLTATATHRDELAKQNDELRAGAGVGPGWVLWVAGVLVFGAGAYVVGHIRGANGH